NAIPAQVSAWLDARAADPDTLAAVVAAVRAHAVTSAERDRTAVTVTEESTTPAVEFHSGLCSRLVAALDGPPVLPTGARPEPGVLAAQVPAAMLFVRNPTGVSHAPAEHATDADCALGVEALADVLEELACR